MVSEPDMPMMASHRQAGFSLIESLIALAVLSFGLLAIAGMQSFALSGNIDSNELTVVSNLAADMMERIRFNWRNAASYNGINTTQPATQPPAAQPQARGDYTQWQARLAAANLSNVVGRVTVAASGPVGLQQNLVTVTVNWMQRTNYAGTAQGTTTGTSTTNVRPNQIFVTRTLTLSTTITPL